MVLAAASRRGESGAPVYPAGRRILDSDVVRAAVLGTAADAAGSLPGYAPAPRDWRRSRFCSVAGRHRFVDAVARVGCPKTLLRAGGRHFVPAVPNASRACAES